MADAAMVKVVFMIFPPKSVTVGDLIWKSAENRRCQTMDKPPVFRGNTPISKRFVTRCYTRIDFVA